MKAGTLNARITIQRRTGGEDAWSAPLPAGWEDVAQDEMTDGAAGDETGLSGASENGADADGVTGSIRETAGSGAAENEGTAGTDGNTMADVNNGSGAENKSVSAAAGAEFLCGHAQNNLLICLNIFACFKY